MIRVARTEQLDLVRALDRAVFPGDEPVELDCGRWWLAWDGDDPVGFGGARILDREDAAVLVRCGVVRAARGRGAQSRLIRARLRWLGEQPHVRTCVTYTTADNVASANNLIATGFRLYRPAWTWAGPDFLYWWRDL